MCLIELFVEFEGLPFVVDDLEGTLGVLSHSNAATSKDAVRSCKVNNSQLDIASHHNEDNRKPKDKVY